MPTMSLSVFTDTLRAAFSPETSYFYLVWSFAIGFFLAIVLSALHRSIVGRIARALTKENADAPERAKSLTELGCAHLFYRFLLRDGATLRNIICFAPTEPQEESAEQESAGKKPFLPSPEAKFYIPEEKSYRASRHFSVARNLWWQVILSAPVLFVLAVAMFWVLPMFL